MSYRSVLRPGIFEGQVALVTGGGSGIGRCTAHELASLGAQVGIAGRNPEKLAAVVAEIEQAGGRAMAFTCDIREEAQVEALVGDVLQAFGRVDALVNNAGGQFAAPLAAITQKGWETVVRTNLTGGFLVARACFTRWMCDHGGRIVNVVADMWGGMPGMGHSGAARAGMVNFTETAALEWAPAGVRVNAVAPGWIASGGLDRYPPEMAEQIRGLAHHVPLGRLGTESEVSAAIAFLLSEGAAFITGTTLRIDGGVPNVRPHWPRVEHEPAPAFDGFHLATRPRVLDEP